MYAEGLRLAVLTSFIRLLELRQEELEDGQQGTGTLESDLKLLQVRLAWGLQEAAELWPAAWCLPVGARMCVSMRTHTHTHASQHDFAALSLLH